MDQRLVVGTLSLCIAVIFLFVGTFAAFMLFKERVCAKSLYSAECYEQYPAYLNHLLGR